MDKRGVVVGLSIFLITVAILVFAIGPYKRGPVYKPYWLSVNNTALALRGQQIGVVIRHGNGGWAIFGFQDNVNSSQRALLLSTIRQLIAEAERLNYTVVIAPWGADNKTNEVLTALYEGAITPQQYLGGYTNISGMSINSVRIDAAKQYALTLMSSLWHYTAYPGYPLAQTAPPSAYAYVVRIGCQYPVFEPYNAYRDNNYSDWGFWVRNAIINLPGLMGKPGCSW